MRESQLHSVFWFQIYSLVLCLSPVFPPFTALKCPGTKTILLNKAPQALDWANPHFQPYLSWTTFMCSSLDPVARSQSMPHTLCFSLLLCSKPSPTQKAQLTNHLLQEDFSELLALSHLFHSHSFQQNAKAQYIIYFFVYYLNLMLNQHQICGHGNLIANPLSVTF